MKVTFTYRFTCLYRLHRVIAVLAIMVMVLPAAVTAQLHLKENTSLVVKSVLTSKEQNNNLYAPLLGEGTLRLDGVQQQLFASEQAWVHHLHIINAANLDITSQLVVRGDLMINSGRLALAHTITLLGDLVMGKDATINDLLYIHRIFNSNVPVASTQQNAVLTNTSYTTAMVPVVIIENPLLINLKKSLIYNNSFDTIHHAMAPPLPPPECV